MILVDVGTSFVKSTDGRGHRFECANLQGDIGPDVMSRVSYAVSKKGGTGHLKDLIHKSLEQHFEFHGKTSDEQVFLIGNSVMEYLFLGIDPSCFAVYPFRRKPYDIHEGRVFFIPGFYSFAGSDIYPMKAMLERSGAENAIALDIGTNCEIIVKKSDRFYVTSAPAGPAFENTLYFSENLIDDFIFSGGGITPVFSRKSPGTESVMSPKAQLRLLAFMIRNGMMKRNGVIRKDIDITYIKRKHINEVLKAKAAISNAFCIMRERFLPGQDFTVFITGNMIDDTDIGDMKELGMLPEDKKVVYYGEGLKDFYKELENENDISGIKEKYTWNMKFFPHYNIPDFGKRYVNEMNFEVML